MCVCVCVSLTLLSPSFTGTMGRAGIRDPEFLKELQELRQNNPSPYIGLFIVKDAEEAKKKGIQITSIDQGMDNCFTPLSDYCFLA